MYSKSLLPKITTSLHLKVTQNSISLFKTVYTFLTFHLVTPPTEYKYQHTNLKYHFNPTTSTVTNFQHTIHTKINTCIVHTTHRKRSSSPYLLKTSLDLESIFLKTCNCNFRRSLLHLF
ncbi:hypothetical protein VIGAN_05192600 [Vigna angularis var. angularis]|uniref:Uncharacterized protein n=1 Tax=Vigna angularis var. angularis TaxID=157739 RepID=A0A0S3S6H2_PHAAN|nr:hypothetical protein VIGAN_05192600 [Vigna angularis var. angularis]